MRVKIQTKQEMMENHAASENEARNAIDLFNMLRPCLKVTKLGRVETIYGDKTPLGLYLTLRHHINWRKET